MLSEQDFERMIRHWLNTRPNSYFGSSYGAPIDELMLKRQSNAESALLNFINKMKVDIPPLSYLTTANFNIWADTDGYTDEIIYLQIGTFTFNLAEFSK